MNNKELKFLIVDDMPTMRRFIRQSLKLLGYSDVCMAPDAESALVLLKGGNFDVLITDWNMPGMSGLELLRQVRADARLKTLPVMLVTAEAKREQILEAIEAEVNGYLVKPVTAKSLKEKLDCILKSYRGPE